MNTTDQNATIAVESVTPEMAQQYLDNLLPNQRSVRDLNVGRLAQDMNTGHFKLTCDALLFIKGKLANGQHRLRAVVKSGVTCQFLVLRTDDESVFQVIDGGTPRRVADYLMSTDALSAASAAAIVLKHERDQLWRSGTSQTHPVTRTEQIEYAAAHRDSIEKWIEFVTPLYNQQRILPKSFAIALLEIASIHEIKNAPKFLEALYRGNSEDVAKVFREQLIANSRSKKKFPRNHVIALLIKAFKMYSEGSTRDVLIFKKDEKSRQVIRRQHKTLATEDCYCGWVRRYASFVFSIDRTLPPEANKNWGNVPQFNLRSVKRNWGNVSQFHPNDGTQTDRDDDRLLRRLSVPSPIEQMSFPRAAKAEGPPILLNIDSR